MNVEDTSMCIYQIKRIETGETYIGQTIKRVVIRWRNHCSPNNCLKLARAIKKYGKAAFEFTVLEVCETIDQLNDREVYWIKELNTLSPSGYNLKTGGKNSIPSEETKLKMSLAGKNKLFSDVTKLKISLAKKGSIISDATKAKLFAANKGKIASEESRKRMSLAGKGRIFSDEHKLKISLANKGKIKSDEHRAKLSAAGKEFYLKQKLEADKNKELENDTTKN